MTEAEEQMQQADLNYFFELGKATGKEEIAKMLSKRSGEYFADNKDDSAKLLRVLSYEIGTTAAAQQQELRDMRNCKPA